MNCCIIFELILPSSIYFLICRFNSYNHCSISGYFIFNYKNISAFIFNILKNTFFIRILFLYTEDGEQELAAYERGWSIYPTGKQEASMDALIAYCATLPPADNWHFRAGGENPTLC